jgi:diketogulonate reductase-like aldo/keto reductase
MDNTIPLVAYGTWVDDIHDAPTMKDRVKTAILLGYRHIDTAKNYGTEPFVIEAMKEVQSLGIGRESLFLTSKVMGYISSESLRSDLGYAQYYDLLLLHYPPLDARSRDEFKNKIRPIWANMQSYITNGITKLIGVSNFYQNHLDLLLEVCDENGFVFPSVNQIEIHPGNLELQYVPYMQSRGILPFAHTSLGGLGSKFILTNEILSAVGGRLGATPAQVVIAYLLRRQIGVATSSKNPGRMAESINIANIAEKLTLDDISIINSTDGFGPMIHGSIASFENNMLLY